MISRLPIVTAAIVACSIVVYAFPELSAWFIFDRSEILSGAWWRIPTSLLVHYSLSNLFWNLMTLAIFGILLETANRRAVIFLFGLSAIGNLLYLCKPTIAYFAGSSGFVIALVTYYCIVKITTGDERRPWILILSFLIGKIAYECLYGTPIFAGGDFYVLPEAHLIGLVCAIFLFFVLGNKRKSVACEERVS